MNHNFRLREMNPSGFIEEESLLKAAKKFGEN